MKNNSYFFKCIFHSLLYMHNSTVMNGQYSSFNSMFSSFRTNKDTKDFFFMATQRSVVHWPDCSHDHIQLIMWFADQDQTKDNNQVKEAESHGTCV